jgi:hypothetical protein
VAYAKFECACGCGEMVQDAGGFRSGHRAPYLEKQEAERAAQQQANIEKLSALWSKVKPPEEAVPADDADEAVKLKRSAPPPSEPPNLCACGCGRRTWQKWARGHGIRTMGQEVPAQTAVKLSDGSSGTTAEVPAYKSSETPLVSIIDGPPMHPAPIDRRRWRIASERPGTPLTAPWIATRCHNCRNPMWTRDPLSTWEHGGMCEEDDYILRSELADHGRKQFQQQARTYHDPFRPR